MIPLLNRNLSFLLRSVLPEGISGLVVLKSAEGGCCADTVTKRCPFGLAFFFLSAADRMLIVIQQERTRGTCSVDPKEKHQYFSVNNGQYYVKRSPEDFFYILTDSGEWKYNPSLSDEFYDVLSGYTEITEAGIPEILCEKQGQPHAAKNPEQRINRHNGGVL